MPLTIVRNDITKMMVDAIANTANCRPHFGRGTDQTIYEAAGMAKMTAARLQVGEIAPGSAAATPAFRLSENGVKYVIHAVYWNWIRGSEEEKQTLRDAYTSTLEIAAELGCKSVALPLFGAGNRGYPIDVAIDEALSTIYAFLNSHDMDVYLVLFSMLSMQQARKLFPEIPSFVDDRYVVQRTREELPPDAELPPAPPASDPQRDETFLLMLERVMDERGIAVGDIYNQTSISRQVFSKMHREPDYHLGKKKVLELAVLLRMSPDEAADFLSRADYAFNPASRFDRIVRSCMEKGVHDLFAIDEILYDAGETLFFDE